MHFSFDETILLENDSVLLQPICAQDIDNLLPVAIEDPTLLQYSPKPVYTKELLTAYINNALEERRAGSRYSFSIFSKQEQRYAGSTAFLNVSNADDRLEIGATWIGRSFHGTGLNTTCKQLLLNYAFIELRANRVEFRVDERNLRSRKAVEKIGGRLEGILRQHMVLHDGFRRNTCYYSILAGECHCPY